MDIEKLDINAVCFGILCNFTPVCGEERAKEAVELVRTLQAENERLKNKLSELAHLPFDSPGVGERTRLMAENEKLRAELKSKVESKDGRVIRRHEETVGGGGIKEYIEKAAVENMLETAQLISDGEYCGYCTEDVSLNSIPAADVAEVRHGRWDASDRYKFLDGSTCIRCTECGAALHLEEYQKYHWHYCPNCGARMDQEDGHENI